MKTSPSVRSLGKKSFSIEKVNKICFEGDYYMSAVKLVLTYFMDY